MSEKQHENAPGDMYLSQVCETINVLEMCNSKNAQRMMQGKEWHVIRNSPNIGFFNTTLEDAFEASEQPVFRYLAGLDSVLNPILCTIKKVGKEMVEFDWAILTNDNGYVGTRDKYVVRDRAIKEKCREIYERDGGYREESSDEYKKAVERCILCMDVARRKSKSSDELKDALIYGIMYMYDAYNSVTLCTEFNGAILAFPVDDPTVLNRAFKNRDVNPGKTRKTTIYSDVKSHGRNNGQYVDAHVRMGGFTYKNRYFWTCLEGESAFKDFASSNIEKARKRFKRHERLGQIVYRDEVDNKERIFAEDV